MNRFIKAYEEFLNVQGCWNLRANFAIKRGELKRFIQTAGREITPGEELKQISPGKKTNDIFRLRARCGFCGQTFDYSSTEETASNVPAIPTEQKIIRVCPKCRNQLPKCSICLGSFGLLNPFLMKSNGIKGPIKFPENFFAWCQRCRHGGHLNHIEEWFTSHTECPVSECTCCCNNGKNFK